MTIIKFKLAMANFFYIFWPLFFLESIALILYWSGGGDVFVRSKALEAALFSVVIPYVFLQIFWFFYIICKNFDL